ncbi:hypothetical protein DYBT9623_00110 [Dyadobacter sp. CECT 9623]|uniref:CarboxypepD_reg-like domain-containing protein n=2 Tax=Dyadobacter linearis TaxID=2823330 RepID=A0ABM8UJI1_9BACT|nr:hypothetical protein DYBT9623_00110 [Dyadobacter sp. CECT 9623]
MLIALIFPALTLAQEKCGILVDADTGNGISYGTLYFNKSGAGSYSAEDGKFCISTLSEIDTITVSCVGYKSLTLAAHEFMQLDSIRLHPSVHLLEEVTIKSSRKPKIRALGFADHAVKKRLAGSSISMNAGVIMASYIENSKGSKGIIRSLTYVLAEHSNKKAILPRSYRVRMWLFSNTVSGLPGQDLLLKPAIVDVSDDQKQIFYTLDEIEIPFPKSGVWVGLETVGYTTQDSIYHEIRTGEFGKFSLKNQRKMVLQNFSPITPMIPMTKLKDTQSATSGWNGRWRLHQGFNDFSTFSFGIEILEDQDYY